MNAPTQRSETTALTTATDAARYGLAPTATVGSAAMILNADHMRQMMAVAQSMSEAVVSVPIHLRGKPGDCLAIVMQATQWNMNPFAVAQKTHVVNGTLGYEAQLVHAVLQATGAIEGTFSYEFEGDGNQLKCRVGAVCAGDDDITWGEWLASALVTTKNSPLWKTNPKQQMGYLQVKNWARAFKPGAILGVYTTDELQAAPPVPEKFMGEAEVVQPAAAAATTGQSFYAEDAFKKNLPSWTELIKTKKKSADAVIKTVETKGAPMTEEQKRQLRAIEAPASADDQPQDAKPAVTYAQVADRMNKAEDLDQLAEAATLIAAIADEAQRGELSAIYERRGAELA